MIGAVWEPTEQDIEIRQNALQMQAERFGVEMNENTQQFVEHVALVMATMDAEIRLRCNATHKELNEDV